MKKIITILATLMLTTMSINFAKAEGYAMGVTGTYASINASGKEVEGGETTKASASNDAIVPSIFIEKQLSNNFTMGIDWIPMSADVNDAVKSRTETDWQTGATTAGTSITNKAQAELSNHITLYGELGEKAYLKFGVAQVEVKTKETLGSGSKYGDKTIYGGVIGVGVKGESSNGVYFKLEGTYTDYENASFTSSVARAGVTTNNKVDADLDVTALKISLGKKF